MSLLSYTYTTVNTGPQESTQASIIYYDTLDTLYSGYIYLTEITCIAIIRGAFYLHGQNLSPKYVYVIVCIRNPSLYIRTAIISVIIYNDHYSWFLYIMANFFQSVYIMTEILVCL